MSSTRLGVGYSMDLKLNVAPEGWFSDEEGPLTGPLTKKQKLQLESRFKTATEEDLDSYTEKQAPKNTNYSTTWAVRNFLDWIKQRNLRFPTVPVPEALLTSGTAKQLDRWLSFYVLETRNNKGKPYPPKTLYQLLCGLLRHMRGINPNAPNFLDKTNPSYKKLHNVIDNRFKELTKEGVGCESKHTEIITKDEENLLWASGVLGLDTPRALLNAVFYYSGKNFCLRGGQEHRDLKISQFTREHDHYIYTENSSKNRQGGWAQLRLENKRVKIYANTKAGDRCLVYILDRYISKLPVQAKERDFFYARPLIAVPFDQKKPWFYSMPIGKNSLNSMFKDMCAEAGVSGHKTNHSLRATGASELFEAGVPEKIIKERTGHRSLEALRLYERTTRDQHQAVSVILSSSQKTSFKDALTSTALTSTDSNQGASSSGAIPNNVFQNCNVHVYQAPVNYVQPSIQPPQTVAVNAELDSLLDFVAEDVLPF